MNGIIGFADLLKQPKLTGEEQQKYIGIIEKSGARLLNIINDLINISKIESGQMEVNYSKTNINEQLDFLFNFFHTEADQKGLHLSVKYPLLFSQAIIITDREKIYAILTNLIKNAIKFTKTGSVEFGYELKGKFYEFYVKDTGTGIPENMFKTIFDRFAQANSDLANGYEGAGLGLSISEAYVIMLGGKIWLESEEGKGTSFYFSIPNNNNSVTFENTPNTDAIYDRKNEMMNKTILVAEDDQESMMYLTIILEGSGFSLILARTGQEAVDICRKKEKIHLILMDIKMPIMDGYTAAKLIKEFRPEVPIIAQTAYALDTEVEKYSKAFDDYLTKPIKASELKAKIALHALKG
jgi:CheY-like chemotaxis protein